MTVRIEAFLALEASLAERLSKTAKKLTTKLYADVDALLKKGDFHGAADLVQTMSLNNVFEDNKRYVEYVFNLAMLFGASRVTRTPGTTVVGLGYEKMMVQQAMLTFRTSVVVRAENHLKNLALQLIAQAKMKANEGQQETIHKEPWTPEKRSAATAKAWLSRRRAEIKTPKVGERVRVGNATHTVEPLDSDYSFPPAVASYEVREGYLTYCGRDGSEGVVTGDKKQIEQWVSDVNKQVAANPPSEAREWSPKDGGEAATVNATEAANRAAALFGITPPKMSFVVADTNVSGEHSGDKVVVYNPQTDRNPDLNFPSKVSGVEHTAAHETVHAAFSSNAEFGNSAMKALSSIKEKVSLYHELAGDFEGLIEAGAAYSHSPTELKSYSPEIYAVVDDWVRKLKANSTIYKADPEASVLLPFASFMDKNGKAFFDIASSLHTSRLSAYGFTAEADVMGYETYQITEQLDPRTCDVCRMMHGKTFKVKEARALLDVVLRTQDPEELQSLQPWPSQSKAGLAELADMDSRTMVEKGWHIPPFHPRCRGLLARSGKVEPLSTPTSVPKPPQEAYTPSAEEFKAFGHNLSQEKLDTWRDVVGIPPAEVIAGLVGTTPDELLAEVLPGLSMTKLKESLGLADLRFAEGSVALRLVRNIFGSKAPVSQTVKFLSKEEQLYLSVLDMDDVDQGSGIAKKYMRRLAALATETEMSSIGLTAGLDVGGYAWAKYGFIPSVDDWTTLKKEITGGALAQNFIKTLSGANLQVFKAIMESTDPKSIFALADVPELGKKLLLGSSWSGKLQLSDPEQMTRFMAYLGASK